MLRQPLTGFPMFVIWFTQTMVSVNRIDDFLKEDEGKRCNARMKLTQQFPTGFRL